MQSNISHVQYSQLIHSCQLCVNWLYMCCVRINYFIKSECIRRLWISRLCFLCFMVDMLCWRAVVFMNQRYMFVTRRSVHISIKWRSRTVAYLLVHWYCFSQLLPRASGVPRGVIWGVQTPPPKFGRYRWSPRSREQEEPASRFPCAVHCVLIRL